MASSLRKRHADACEWLTQCPSKRPRIVASATTIATPGHPKGDTISPHASRLPHLRTPLMAIPNGTNAQTVAHSKMKPKYTPYAPNSQSHPPQPSVPPSRSSKVLVTMNGPTPDSYKPAVLHQPHPDSRLYQSYHWVPYPLGLMPYDSWHRLHHRDNFIPLLPFRCPVCRQERKAKPHTRKVFLVAERLSWDERMVSMSEKELNEELNRKVSYELGILDPFIEDPERPPGGKHSRHNRFHPYQNEHEMKLALKLIFMTEDITEATWALWIGAQLDVQSLIVEEEKQSSRPEALTSFSSETGPAKALIDKTRPHTPDAIEIIDLTKSPGPSSEPVNGRPHQLPNAQSSLPMVETDRRIRSYRSLQDFYYLLDKIERTSYVSAVFLEAYAEKLRDDMCQNCWLRHNINFDFF